MIAIKRKLFAMRMSKAGLIIFIVPINYCIALFAHLSQMLTGCIISTFSSSPLAYANSKMSSLLRSPSIPTKRGRLSLSSTGFFGPTASPLSGDLNFLINTFLTDLSEGWRTRSTRSINWDIISLLWNQTLKYGYPYCELTVVKC